MTIASRRARAHLPRFLAAWLSVLLGARATAAQEPRVPDLTIEELMEITVLPVFGASERLQPVTEAPSSVTIVTADDIRRYGYETLADILRGVRGFYVTSDRSYDFVGVRGFSRPGDYNTRVLLLVDGHRFNDIVFDQATVGHELRVDAALFERVEIIRGPASSLYGASAFFAVINVITRSGASLSGGWANLEAGTLGTRRMSGAYGTRLANGVDWAVSATRQQSDGNARLYFPAFDSPATNNGVAEHLDGQDVSQVFGRFGFKELTVTGSYGTRTKLLPTAAVFALFNHHAPSQHKSDEYGALHGHFGRNVGRALVNVDATFDWSNFAAVGAYDGLNPAVPTLIRTFGAQGTRAGISSRVSRPIGGHVLTVGSDFVQNIDQDTWLRHNDPLVPDDTIEQSSLQAAVYAIDEIKLRPWLLVNGGLRHDRYAHFDRTTPRGAVVLLPSPNQSFKYLYGRAFRAPNAAEVSATGQIDATLRPEAIDTHEVVWEQYVGRWLRTSMSTYHSVASQLITFEPNDVGGLGAYRNGSASIRAVGLELEAEVRSKRGFQAFGSYARQRATDEATGSTISNSPSNVATLRISLPTPVRRASAALEWQYLGTRQTLAGDTLAPASVVAVTVNHPIRPALVLTGKVRNLFNRRYADPASSELSFDSIERDGRTASIGVRWMLGKP
jgi:outer membrane receptor for ferrienterochelin and colicins